VRVCSKCCEHGIEASDPSECEERVDELSDCQSIAKVAAGFR
jgi:hypothetical protein